MSQGIPVSVTGPVKVDDKQTKKVTDFLSAILTATATIAGRGTKDDPFHVVFDSSGLEGAIGRVADAISDLTKPPIVSGLHFEGGGFMRTYAGDRPAEKIDFAPARLVDSEGTVLPDDKQPQLDYSLTSSNPDVVGVSFDENGKIDATYGTPHKLEDNSYEIVEIRAESQEITLDNDEVIKDVKTEQIQLVPGSAVGLAGGGMSFPEA